MAKKTKVIVWVFLILIVVATVLLFSKKKNNNDSFNDNKGGNLTIDDLCKRYIGFSKNVPSSTINNNSVSQSKKMSVCKEELIIDDKPWIGRVI